MTAVASATPDAAARAVTLELVDVPLGPVTVWRDAAGARRAVRVPEGSDRVVAGGALTLTDYDAPLGVALAYLIEDPSTGTLYGPVACAPVPHPSRGAVMHLAGWPWVRWEGLNVVTASLAQSTGAQLHNVIGRADPVDTGSVGLSREGQIIIDQLPWATARAIANALAPVDAVGIYYTDPAARYVVLRHGPDLPGWDGCYVVSHVALDHSSGQPPGRQWSATLAVRESFGGPRVRP